MLLTRGLLIDALAGCSGSHAAGTGLSFVAFQLASMTWNTHKDSSVAALGSAMALTSASVRIGDGEG